MPLVSVLMAVHNGEHHVAEAVDSILGQDFPDFEFLVIDDASTDATADILGGVDDSRVSVLRHETNLGLTRSLNIGLRAASGSLVARMDADDVSLPSRLARQVGRLDVTKADICFTRYRHHREDTGHAVEWREAEWPLTLWRGLFTNAYGAHSSVLFRREAVLALGGYDESFRRAQDYDLWDRCVARGLRFAYVPQEFHLFRSHADSITRLHRAEQDDAARRVSRRALVRTFPDAAMAELDGLRWLMIGGPPPADRSGVAAALAGVTRRVRDFAPGSPPALWREVALRLRRRLADLASAEPAVARRCLLEAALRSRSPRTLAGAVRSCLSARTTSTRNNP